MTEGFDRAIDGPPDDAAPEVAAADDPMADDPVADDPVANDLDALAVDPAIPEPSSETAVPTSIVPGNAGDASLLGLIDRLGSLLERSDLTELEVEVGGTALVLRKPAALAPPLAAATLVADPASAAASPAVPASTPTGATGAADAPAAPVRPSIAAPLTGIWYASPAPGSAPFVEVGREVAVGQVVGLIEAMKLFNEIKSDLAGRVVRVVPESGALVKAKQPLIEVEPL
jgi:acetyl-CoA carboxylase biotin carboxyl carrier protein